MSKPGNNSKFFFKNSQTKLLNFGDICTLNMSMVVVCSFGCLMWKLITLIHDLIFLLNTHSVHIYIINGPQLPIRFLHVKSMVLSLIIHGLIKTFHLWGIHVNFDVYYVKMEQSEHFIKKIKKISFSLLINRPHIKKGKKNCLNRI